MGHTKGMQIKPARQVRRGIPRAFFRWEAHKRNAHRNPARQARRDYFAVFCLQCKGTANESRPGKRAGDCFALLLWERKRKANESPAREARRDFPGVACWKYKGNANKNAAREARRGGKSGCSVGKYKGSANGNWHAKRAEGIPGCLVGNAKRML